MFREQFFLFLDLHACLRHVLRASCSSAYPNLEILILESSIVTRNTDPAGQSGQPSTLDRAGTPEPIGRGQPLPPPGQPLPFPERKSHFSLPRRKPIPAPSQMTGSPIEKPSALTQRGQDERKSHNSNTPPAPLPKRRRQGSDIEVDRDRKELLVVEVPSEPSSPVVDSSPGPSRSGSESRRSSSISQASDGVKARTSITSE